MEGKGRKIRTTVIAQLIKYNLKKKRKKKAHSQTTLRHTFLHKTLNPYLRMKRALWRLGFACAPHGLVH